MEEQGTLLVYGTRADADLVVQTLYGVLPMYGKARINDCKFYQDAYEVNYEFSGTTVERLKVRAKICLALRKLSLIPRIKSIKRL